MRYVFNGKYRSWFALQKNITNSYNQNYDTDYVIIRVGPVKSVWRFSLDET